MIASNCSRSASVDQRVTVKSTVAVFGPLFVLMAKPVNFSCCAPSEATRNAAASAQDTRNRRGKGGFRMAPLSRQEVGPAHRGRLPGNPTSFPRYSVEITAKGDRQNFQRNDGLMP